MKNGTIKEVKREISFNVLLGQIRQILRVPVAALEVLPDNEATQQHKKDITQITNEILPVYALASAIHKHGLPTSLIFINQTGMAIDLLKIEELNQESAFNELLDNMK